MGTFERIRQTSPYALALFVVIFIGFFVLSDADIGTIMRKGQNPQTAPIAVVNDQEILYKDFNEKVQQRIKQQRAQQQKDENFQPDEKQIRQDVWNEMIRDALLKQEAEKAGIFVSEEEILDVMIENPPQFLKKTFSDSAGNFNKSVYLQIITNPERLGDYLSENYPQRQIQSQIKNLREDLINIEKYIREQKLTTALTNLVNTSETILSPQYLKERYFAENAKTSVDFIFFDVNEIADNEISVSEDEIKEYYNERKKYYEQKPRRRVKYVKFPVKPSKNDSLRAKKRIEDIINSLENAETQQAKDSVFDVKMSEYGGETSEYKMTADVKESIYSHLDTLEPLDIIGPIENIEKGTTFLRLDDKRVGENDQIKASHILIKSNGNKDSAKKEAQKILKKAKSGEKFAELAPKYSQDPGSAKKGGDLGYFKRGYMIEPFEKAAFGAEPGEVVGPVESQFGYHIIKVFDKKSEEIKFSKITIKPLISSQTKNKIFRNAYSIYNQAQEGVSFDTLVARLNLVAAYSGYKTKEQSILGSQYLTHLAFSNSVGTVLEPIELEPYGIVTAMISDVIQSGIKPLEDVRERIIKEIAESKKLDLVEKRANKFYQENIAGLTELRDFKTGGAAREVRTVESFNYGRNIPKIGIDNVFSVKVFEIPTGKINKPFAGERGAYITQVYKRNTPDTSDVQKLNRFKQTLIQQEKKRKFYAWLEKIREKAVIEDMRHNFYTNY